MAILLENGVKGIICHIIQKIIKDSNNIFEALAVAYSNIIE